MLREALVRRALVKLEANHGKEVFRLPLAPLTLVGRLWRARTFFACGVQRSNAVGQASLSPANNHRCLPPAPAALSRASVPSTPENIAF